MITFKNALTPIVLFSLLTLAPLAHAGQEGHGGDPNTLDFRMIGQILGRAMYRTSPNLLPADWDKFVDTVNSTDVRGLEHVCLYNNEPDLTCAHGLQYEVAAVNIPASKMIYVGLSRWRTEKVLRKKVTLVYHEYMDVLTDGKDDGGELSVEFWSAIENNPVLRDVIEPPSPEELE